MRNAREFNFDGLVGPSHNYAGLSFGNVASFNNVRSASNPRQAALQGLAKMRALAARGFAQGLLPPQARPNFRLLRRLGFTGTDADVLARAYRESPVILACAYSASPMWTANAATVSPSADTADGRVHFTAANLNNKLHRAEEHVQATRTLRALFANPDRFVVHDPLPSTPAFGDEGAANHTRFASAHGAAGVEFFVYGRVEFDPSAPAPTKYPARQTLEASQAVARLHGLDAARTVFASQNPAVIDQGVFHNDVIAVGNGNVLFYHDQAFADEAAPVELATFSRAGGIAGGASETVVTGKTEIVLNWSDFHAPFVLTLPPGFNDRPIGVFSTFFPARSAQILLNNKAASGKPWAEKRGDRDASSACLAWSETWVKPR